MQILSTLHPKKRGTSKPDPLKAENLDTLEKSAKVEDSVELFGQRDDSSQSLSSGIKKMKVQTAVEESKLDKLRKRELLLKIGVAGATLGIPLFLFGGHSLGIPTLALEMGLGAFIGTSVGGLVALAANSAELGDQEAKIQAHRSNMKMVEGWALA